jgi:hypothetical protein
MQALSGEQSELMTHSGRQLGGEPIMVGRQEHWHCSPTVRGGLLLGPQGFGWQGSTATTGSMARRTEELPIAQQCDIFLCERKFFKCHRYINTFFEIDMYGRFTFTVSLTVTCKKFWAIIGILTRFCHEN